MSDLATRHQNFRSFLTARFTAVAVDIFEEVETIIEAYYEENKRLSSIIHAVLSPEIKLPRIDTDANRHTQAFAGIREQPPEPKTQVDLQISEPLTKKPKIEESEYEICSGSEQGEGLEGADNWINPDFVKKEEEKDRFDSNMTSITDLYNIKVIDWNPDSSTTLSADESCDELKGSFKLEPDGILSMDEEGACTSWVLQKDVDEADNKMENISMQRTMLVWPRMMPDKTTSAAPADRQTFLTKLSEGFKGFPDGQKPLITKMGLTAVGKSVDCQHPVTSSHECKADDAAPPRPHLPLSSHTLGSTISSLPILSSKEVEHMKDMQISWEEAHHLECSTRGQEGSLEEMQKLRLTSHFREICKLKSGQSHADHLIFKMQNLQELMQNSCKTKKKNKRMKSEVLRQYCRNLGVYWYSCGLIVHPNAPWLGAMPDGLVYDPKETPNFGLVHTKCVCTRRFIDCKFLHHENGVLQLKKAHSYYWHIQAEMMIAGMSWCDLLVFSREDILVQRIYREKAIIDIMKYKLGDFFFYYYLPSLISPDVTS